MWHLYFQSPPAVFWGTVMQPSCGVEGHASPRTESKMAEMLGERALRPSKLGSTWNSSGYLTELESLDCTKFCLQVLSTQKNSRPLKVKLKDGRGSEGFWGGQRDIMMIFGRDHLNGLIEPRFSWGVICCSVGWPSGSERPFCLWHVFFYVSFVFYCREYVRKLVPVLLKQQCRHAEQREQSKTKQDLFYSRNKRGHLG